MTKYNKYTVLFIFKIDILVYLCYVQYIDTRIAQMCNIIIIKYLANNSKGSYSHPSDSLIVREVLGDASGSIPSPYIPQLYGYNSTISQYNIVYYKISNNNKKIWIILGVFQSAVVFPQISNIQPRTNPCLATTHIS